MSRIDRALDGNWTLTCLGGQGARPGLPEAIPATVPGTVHTDLLAAGLIPDPYLDLNEIAVDWVGRCDWRYETTFNWSDDDEENVELVFAGLDTFATISLNGVLLGENQLSVSFESAWKRGEALDKIYEPRPNNYPGPANLMRKMACNFGWDWGPTVVTSGLWQGVSLQSWSKARLRSIRPEITLAGADGHVRIHAEVEGDAANLTLRINVAGQTSTAPIGTAEMTVEKPELWWPTGLGNQPLYALTVDLLDGETVLDTWQRDIGFRSLRLDTTPDEEGTPFAFIINDVPIYICGANWIPDDCFLPRVTPERYASRIAQAKAANMNMLRVWGGGIYETEAFYEECDRQGMLVWQDFLFACAMRAA